MGKKVPAPNSPPETRRIITRSVSKVLAAAAKNAALDNNVVLISSDEDSDEDSPKLPVPKRVAKSRTKTVASPPTKKLTDSEKVKSTPGPASRKPLALKRRNDSNALPVVQVDDDDDDTVIVIPLPKKQRPPETSTKLGVKTVRSVKSTPEQAVSDAAAKLLTDISPSQFTAALFNSGAFTADVLDRSSEEYTNILDYIINSQVHCFGVKMLSIVKITQPSHQMNTAQTLAEPANDFKMMLFHGTKHSTVAEIMKSGFRCPPNGLQMFGQGIYFADRVSKSSLYCTNMFIVPPPVGTIGYIFVCEVQLGRIYNAKNANHSYKSPPSIIRKNGAVVPCDSLMCTGANIPNRDRQRKIGDVIWPLGPTVKNSKFETYTVNYNEFIVYDPNRIKVKYLAKVEITSSPYFTY